MFPRFKNMHEFLLFENYLKINIFWQFEQKHINTSVQCTAYSAVQGSKQHA